MEMLDLIVHKGPRWQHTRRVDYHVRIRKSALCIILSDSSLHHPSIHRAWPKARVGTIVQRCSTKHAANIAVKEFVDKIANQNPMHAFLNSLIAYGRDTRSRPSSNANASWLVLPFHPVWYASGHSAAINRIFLEWKLSLRRSEKMSRI